MTSLSPLIETILLDTAMWSKEVSVQCVEVLRKVSGKRAAEHNS